MITVRCLGIWAGLAAGLALAPFGTGEAAAQGAPKNVTYVQPNPSAINSFQVYVAIGEGYFKEEGLNVRVESVDERPFPVQVDGDHIGEVDSVDFGVLPGALLAVA